MLMIRNDTKWQDYNLPKDDCTAKIRRTIFLQAMTNLRNFATELRNVNHSNEPHPDTP